MTMGWLILIILALLGCLLNFIMLFINFTHLNDKQKEFHKEHECIKRKINDFEDYFKRRFNEWSDDLKHTKKYLMGTFVEYLNAMLKDWHLITADASTWPPLNTMVLITDGERKHILSFANYETFQQQNFCDSRYFWHVYESNINGS